MKEITYGLGIASESTLRLASDINENWRVVELGIGQDLNPIAFAQRGVRTIVVDPNESKIKELRVAANNADVRIECHVADYADLGFATTGSVDLVVANQSLAYVDDLGRALRQINRVLKNNRAVIIAVDHPYASPSHAVTSRSIGDHMIDSTPGVNVGTPPSSIENWFTQLSRTNFRVDQLLEFGDSDRNGIPQNLVLRGRKEGD